MPVHFTDILASILLIQYYTTEQQKQGGFSGFLIL